MQSIESLAEDARQSIEDLFEDDERWEWFQSLPPAVQVQWRYCHADCDDFAVTLHEITGWNVIAISHPRQGPVHRLVETPEGRMLDAYGWTSIAELRQRYGAKNLRVDRDSTLCCPMVSDDDDFHPIVDAILQFTWAPFDEPEFRGKTLEFGQRMGMSPEELPQIGAGNSASGRKP